MVRKNIITGFCVALCITFFSSALLAEQFTVYWVNSLEREDEKVLEGPSLVDVDISNVSGDENIAKTAGEAVLNNALASKAVFELNKIKKDQGFWFIYYDWGYPDEGKDHFLNCKIDLANKSVWYERCK